MFQLTSGSNHDSSVFIIMFNELSQEAQKKALDFKGVDSTTKKHWDVCPMAYIDNIPQCQNEIDDEALAQIGYYRMNLST